MEPKFFICRHCGNVATKMVDAGAPLVCCGEKMEELTANTVDAAQEKHVPVLRDYTDQVEVVVGGVIHPMEEKHFIAFIYLVTDKGEYIKKLAPGEEPKAVFALKDEKVIAAYEYCNLHGLWKVEA